MTQKTLAEYSAEKILSGEGKTAIKEKLLAVGWTEDEVDLAYAEALKSSGIPVPDAGGHGAYAKKSSTLEVILNFFSFILLGIIATALGTLFFEVITKYFPDPLSPASSRISSGSVHYAISALVIAFPMYVFSMRLWFRKFREDEGKTESKLTKWVTYLVLLGVSVTIVGDLIATLFTFLQGEMSMRFFLKALTILVITGGIFGFYFLERKKVQYRQEISRTVFQYFGWGLLGVIVLGIVLGFLAAGSPETERKRTFDDRRASNLSNLASCIDQYAGEYGRLPETIATLEKSNGSNYYCTFSKYDPETKDAYQYHIVVPSRVTGTTTEAEYELCANFSLPSDASVDQNVSYPYSETASEKWSTHNAGLECDTQTVVLKKTDAVLVK